MRALALAFTLFLVGSGLGAAVSYTNPVDEQLVEGHTVWTVLEIVSAENTSEVEFASAVAVLIQETQRNFAMDRFAGVLWFNDQYLTEPTSGSGSSSRTRYPCTGAVLAVNAGDPDPRAYPLVAYNDLTYVESYLLTDPMDHVWNVDKWNMSGFLVWTVALQDLQAGYSIPDDGECRGRAYSESSCGDELVNDPWCGLTSISWLPEGTPGRYKKDPGDNGQAYRSRKYNALLYFYLEDLRVPATPKNHTENSPDWNADATGCQPPMPGTRESWPCPGGNDDREGNSHPYNPDDTYLNRRWAGLDNHGGSADCDADGAAEMDCHATRLVDLYYGTAAAPRVRNYRLIDGEGSAAPYHCHDYDSCNPPVETV